jgi:uncharacterized protein with FMN-binding domain
MALSETLENRTGVLAVAILVFQALLVPAIGVVLTDLHSVQTQNDKLSGQVAVLSYRVGNLDGSNFAKKEALQQDFKIINDRLADIKAVQHDHESRIRKCEAARR